MIDLNIEFCFKKRIFLILRVLFLFTIVGKKIYRLIHKSNQKKIY